MLDLVIGLVVLTSIVFISTHYHERKVIQERAKRELVV